MSRSVRLKEHKPCTIKERFPNEDEYKLYNGTIEFKAYIHKIDQNGFVSSLYASELAGADKVVMLGDSFFECSFIEDGSRLCDLMNTMSFQGDRRLEFLNAGYAATTTLNLLVSFIAKVIPLKPTKLIICADAFDDECWNDERSYWTPHPWYSVLLPVQAPFNRKSRKKKSNSAYKTLIDGLYAMCRAENIELYIITKPICPESAWSKSRLKYFENKVRGLKSYNDTVRAYCKRNKGCHLIDIDRLIQFKWNDFYDANHLNSSGVSKLAEALYPVVSTISFRAIVSKNTQVGYKAFRRKVGSLVRKIERRFGLKIISK